MSKYKVCDDKSFTVDGARHEENTEVELDPALETTKAALAAGEIKLA